MKTSFSPKNNPRVIIIQKLYGKFFNDDEKLSFPKHRFKKFIKDIVSGTIERNEIIIEELDKNLNDEKFILPGLGTYYYISTILVGTKKKRTTLCKKKSL